MGRMESGISTRIQSSSSQNQLEIVGGVRKRVPRRAATKRPSRAHSSYTSRNRDGVEGISKESMKANVSNDIEQFPPDSQKDEQGLEKEVIVLQGTIPDVLEWTRAVMDEKSIFCCSCSASDKACVGQHSISAREFARRLHAQYKFRIITGEGVYWKSEVRWWENVCALSSRLPCEGKANIVFDAMRRYPSSALVNYGLKIVFGRQMIIGARRIPRLPISRNAVALFSPSVNNQKSIKEWYEQDTHVRLQETVIHMSAASEYILRCAYIAKQKGDLSRFPSLMEERIQIMDNDRKQITLVFQPWNILMELSEENASACLEEAMAISHNAVITGARAAYKRYGRKSTLGKERERIKLGRLQRPLDDVMDEVIRGIERVAERVVGTDLDFDVFRLQATRVLRKVAMIYEDVGKVKVEANREEQRDETETTAGSIFAQMYVFTPKKI